MLLPMTNSVDINQAVKEAEELLANDTSASPALKASVKMLLIVVKMLSDRLGLNSLNSNKPPASDPNREKRPQTKSNKPRGGQPGHPGKNLEPVEDPDKVCFIKLDRRTLPKGTYTDGGYESRQVFDIRISRSVTEYRAQVLIDESGRRFVADFPQKVTRSTQYGASVKANAVYMSIFQLIPYERVETHFSELFDTPISAGSVYNFNLEAFERLALFEQTAKAVLRQEKTLHVDETSINVNGSRLWLHNASSASWTLIAPHAKRGNEAVEEMDILPHYKGVLVHDHWKPYYRYTMCLHALCNAHHQRELTRAFEQDGQEWARKMALLLQKINTAVKQSDGCLTEEECRNWRRQYRSLLKKAELECPPPEINKSEQKKRGRLARSKSRNLLERLQKYEQDVLRFMENPEAPYTNNQGERDIRMAKVQQKISGCFRSMAGAEIFCRIRSYLSTCRKHGVGVGEALESLFSGERPEFLQKKMTTLKISAE
ncbi:IS66 family transposase [Microbulbifer sp. ZKSA006]|uniref:IS66 family transposase n=1 Tax=Microbulbifer sp. ZKSA006 TaxID=3243390 RepID=UPI004039C757